MTGHCVATGHFAGPVVSPDRGDPLYEVNASRQWSTIRGVTMLRAEATVTWDNRKTVTLRNILRTKDALRSVTSARLG